MSNNGTNSGATPAPGVINVVTKKAGLKPSTIYTQTFSGKGNFGEYIDISRRFGRNDNWGLRVMAEYMAGELSLKNAKKGEKNMFINLDKHDDTYSLNIFAGIFDLRVDKGQRWFTYKGSKDILPTAPNSNIDYDFKGTTKWTYGYLAVVNYEKMLNPMMGVFVNWGYNYRSGNKYHSDSNMKFNEKGDFIECRANAHNEAGTNQYIQAGIKGVFRTKTINNEISVAIDRSFAYYWDMANYTARGDILGNIYSGVYYTPKFRVPQLKPRTLAWSEINTGITAADYISIGNANILLALSRKEEQFINERSNQKIHTTTILPTYGISYKINKKLTAYVGHTESVSRGAVVPENSNGNKMKNAGEILLPSKSKQNEIGIKYKNKNLFTTLSIFHINQQNLIDTEVSSGVFKRGPDGRELYKGIEWTINGEITPKLVVTGGILYLDAKRIKTKGGENDGKFVNAVSDLSMAIGLIYQVNKKLALTGRYNWVGEAYIDNNASLSKSVKIPEYATVDMGINYKFESNGIPITLNIMCYNVTNKNYWIERAGALTFGLSVPRTIMCSMKFTF